MKFEFSEIAWEDFIDWRESDPIIFDKILSLLKDIRRNPFIGIGKPEPLKFDLHGYWSRRISKEHRLIYKVEGVKGKIIKCIILACKFHYT